MGELLRTKFLSDKDSSRLYAMNPEMKSSPTLFCPTCRTKKYYRWHGIEYECDCPFQLQLYKHYLNSGVGANFMRLSFDDFDGDPEVKKNIEKYLSYCDSAINKGIGILLYGSFGIGKTMIIMLLMKELIKLGYSCFCTSFTSMIEMSTAGWYSADEKQYYREKVKGSQVLFIDDLGKELKTKTNLSESTFDDVLRYRVTAGRPTMITTNMTPTEMRTGYGSAIFSLLQELSMSVQMTGVDHRPLVMARNIEELNLDETRPIC